jgi:hypothetical protein
MATDPLLALEQLDVVRSVERARRTEAGDAGTDYRDPHAEV